MTGIACAQVRSYLSPLAGGSRPTTDPETFQALLAHGAVTGTPERPEITPVGRHVLSELEVRAYRVDDLSLEFVAGHLDRILGDLDHVAKTAEYFLAELGPVTPPDALPLVRPVAVSLANRRETPDELAEEFRNAWGSVEVMGGSAADRLMAAELLNASSADIATVYGPMNNTVQLVRDRLGASVPAVTVSALLHLHPRDDGSIATEEYFGLRSTVGGEESAAVLAPQVDSVESGQQRFSEMRDALAAVGATDSAVARTAAAYLTAIRATPAEAVPRVQALVEGLGTRLPRAYTAAAVLGSIDVLSPGELLNWFDKATEIAKAHRLAPSPAELAALGTSLVAGLPPGEFSPGMDLRGPPPVPLAALVALHAWLYRPLVVRPASEPASAPPAAAA